jgi:N-acetyl-gamma-glutamyl-phosphate reductase
LIRAIVIGAGGYAGGELVASLLSHAGAQAVGLYGSAKKGEQVPPPTPFGRLFPQLRGRTDLMVEPYNEASALTLEPDVAFLATPHMASLDLAPGLLDAGVVVVDLSAAFRLRDAALYPRHYGFEHTRPDLLASAVYGIPEINREALRSADLIAAAGCYPTSAILALHPLVKAGAIERGRRPIVDSTSGVSGAGRQALPKTSFCEVSLQPYEVLHHRHTPEMNQHAGVPVVFTPHLGAYDRGIVSTIHVDLAAGWTAARVGEAYRNAYEGEAFVRLLPAGEWPSVAGVKGTNFCDLQWAVDEAHRHLIVVSAIDNLVKGAAGQAVQCMNVRFGLPESQGLLPSADVTGVRS